MRTVSFVQTYIFQYRMPFYERLREELAHRNVRLRLVYGDATGIAAQTKDTVTVPWGIYVPNKAFTIFGKELVWQPCVSHVSDADLVVVEQASSRLVNYVLLGRQLLGKGAVAFWGHGKNPRHERFTAIAEFVKRIVSRFPKWWFAYNRYTAEIVEGLGYPSDRITNVQNAVDTSEFRSAIQAVTDEQVAATRAALGLSPGPVVLFCGALYDYKRLDFLIESVALARMRVPDLNLVVIGDGPEAGTVRRAADEHDWVVPVGQVFEADRAPHFALADLLLLPGALGLAVVDGFVAGVPTVTSLTGVHGPEIDYLEDGRNGIVVDDGGDPRLYADAIAGVIGDGELHAQLVKGCLEAADVYTLDEMVRRFADGIEQALATVRPS